MKPHRVHPQWTSPQPQHELWKPNSWLGAYYKLSEGDPARERSKEKLKGRRTPTRGNFIVKTLEERECQQKINAEPWRAMEWRVGTYLEVDHTPRVGDATERIVGILINKKNFHGLGNSFRLLCHVDNTPVEYQFQTFSPLLQKITLKQESQWRDGKKYLSQLRPVVHKLNFPEATKLVKKKVVEAFDPTKFSGRSRGEQA